MTTQGTRIITNGPGELDFSYAHMKGTPVKFTIKDGVVGIVEELRIDGARPEEGSRKGWIIDGYVLRMAPNRISMRKFSGYYQIDSRKGSIQIEE